MTASEKLKALDDLTTYPQGAIARSDAAHIRGRRLLDCLPQIVAVVEAAEARFDGTSYETATPTAFGKSALYDALAALDEVLT